MTWIQAYSPLPGGMGASAAVAAIPLALIFVFLAVLGMKVFKAAILSLAAALCLAIFVWGMPAPLALLAAAQGAAFGMFPVFYIVLATLFLYNITVKGGQFEIIRASLAGVTPDRRLQALLIAFCFGAFIEGAAGFGAPVAIAGATLVGLGFRPLYAAGLCLVANTAPVAFGTIGIPIVALGGVMGLNEAGLLKLSAMVGHQLPLISLMLPAYLILIMAGPRRTLEVLPAVAACGVTFATCQWAVSTFLGPYLPDLLSSLAAMGALMMMLRFWKPKTIYRFEHDPAADSEGARYTASQVARAWLPYMALTAMVLLWGVPAVKAALNRGTVTISVRGLDNAITRMPDTAPAAAGTAVLAPQAPILVPAKFKLDYLASSGTAVLAAALVSALACGLGAGATGRLLARTLHDMRYPALTITSVLALAYVMNASGMTACLGIWSTRAGRMFPFISPILGWLGVFLTGSDTSSNILFGGLQKTAATHLGINPILTAAGNTSGGVMGKMISPQSLAVACAATGMVGEEGKLFRFTLKHSLLLLLVIALTVYLQAYYLTWMIPS
jgi:lactate permease